MVRRGDDVIVLWPRYFDRRLSRAEGRRVPQAMAVRDPDAKWVLSAAEKAGFECQLEEKPKDPQKTWGKGGRVILTGKGNKEARIRQIGQLMAASKDD